MAAIRHLGFLKIQNFNGRQDYEGEHASSVKPLPRYSNFLFFKMAAVRHRRFLNFQNFNSQHIGGTK